MKINGSSSPRRTRFRPGSGAPRTITHDAAQVERPKAGGAPGVDPVREARRTVCAGRGRSSRHVPVGHDDSGEDALARRAPRFRDRRSGSRANRYEDEPLRRNRTTRWSDVNSESR